MIDVVMPILLLVVFPAALCTYIFYSLVNL